MPAAAKWRRSSKTSTEKVGQGEGGDCGEERGPGPAAGLTPRLPVVQRRLKRIEADGERMVQEVEHMYDMAILRLPPEIREMNWLEFFGEERGRGCWAEGPLPPQIIMNPSGCKGGAGIYPACSPQGRILWAARGCCFWKLLCAGFCMPMATALLCECPRRVLTCLIHFLSSSSKK